MFLKPPNGNLQLSCDERQRVMSQQTTAKYKGAPAVSLLAFLQGKGDMESG